VACYRAASSSDVGSGHERGPQPAKQPRSSHVRFQAELPNESRGARRGRAVPAQAKARPEGSARRPFAGAVHSCKEISHQAWTLVLSDSA